MIVQNVDVTNILVTSTFHQCKNIEVSKTSVINAHPYYTQFCVCIIPLCYTPVLIILPLLSCATRVRALVSVCAGTKNWWRSLALAGNCQEPNTAPPSPLTSTTRMPALPVTTILRSIEEKYLFVVHTERQFLLIILHEQKSLQVLPAPIGTYTLLVILKCYHR